MNDNYSSETITIKNSDATLLVNHPEIKKAIGKIGTLISDSYTNFSSVDITVPVINDTLKTTFANFNSKFDSALKDYKSLVNQLQIISLETVNKRDELCGPLIEIEKPEALLSNVIDFADYFGLRATAMIAGINYADENIEKYNNGTITDIDLKNNIDAIGGWMNGNDFILAEHSIAQKAVNEIFSNSPILGSGLAFLINASANRYRSTTGRINSLLSNTYNKFNNILENLDIQSKPNAWINMSVGTVMYATTDFLVRLCQDEGNLLPEDVKKIGTYTVIDAATFFANSAIVYAGTTIGTLAGTAAGGILGTIGGPLGAAAGYVLGALIIYPTGRLLAQTIVGDGIIYEYDLNGKHYEIPLNGIGENGDYDALFSRYENGLILNRKNDNESMYMDLDYYLNTNCDQGIESISNGSVTEYDYNIFKELLDETYIEWIKGGCRQDPNRIFNNLCIERMNDSSSNFNMAAISECRDLLYHSFGFDMEEYVNVQKHSRME